MDLKKYVTVGEDGKVEFNTEAFNADIDREKSSAINTFSANNSKKLEDEIRKKLEEEAKLTAEEKLKQEREEFEALKLATYKEIAQSKARTKLENANLFDKAEIEAYLELVNNDESISKIDKIITARTKYNSDYEKSLKEKLLGETPNPESGKKENDGNIGAIYAKQYQNQSKSTVDTTNSVFANLMN